MPVTKIKKKCINDKFYTKHSVAMSCIDVMRKFIMDDSIVYIEPSAGSGAFSKLIQCQAFDIAPDDTSIQKENFLSIEDRWPNEKLCVFGNPPFGERNNLTKAFIKKAISFSGTKYIAFILPAVYRKRTMQRVFPDNWSLVYSKELPDDAFMFEGTQYHVPCVFQIWEKDAVLKNMREVTQPRECVDFLLTTKDNADIFVFGAAPHKIIDVSDVTPTNRGHYIKTKIDISVLRDRITSVDWKTYASSSVNGGVAWFSSDEFMKHYTNTHGV